MNILLAELLNSVPTEFSVKERKKDSIRFQDKNKEIYIDWYDNGQPSEVAYFENGKFHRPSSEGPALQYWYLNGQPLEITYYKNGQCHRPSSEGPAYQYWHDNGQPQAISYYENGVRHLPPNEGPAFQCWNEDGSLQFEEYYENGQPCNGGPTK